MPRPRAKHTTLYRIEVTKITTTSRPGEDDVESGQVLLSQHVDSLDLPAVLKAVNGL